MRGVLALLLLARLAAAQDSLIPPVITCGAGLSCAPNPIVGPGTISLTDNDTTAGLCLLSGGAGGDPAYSACPGGIGMTSFTLAGSGGSGQTITDGNTALIAGGNALTTTGAATDTVTVDLDGALWIEDTAGVDCTGATDSTTGINNALSAAVAAGKALIVPSGCILGLASPATNNTFCTGSGNPLPCCMGPGTGTCHLSITVPSGAKIFCQDTTAIFRALRQRCTGGTYVGAACNTDSECSVGGGTCDNDFSGTSANPCISGTCYAATSGDTYTMFMDTAPSNGIEMYNCSIEAGQADPFQRCQGGSSAGNPCRQECGNGSTIPGDRCNGGDCGAGTCLRTADCSAGGGTCDGVPKSLTGPGKIDPINFARTPYAKLYNVRIQDHFSGDFGIRTYGHATLVDVNVAAAVNNCTSPFTTPTASFCFGSLSGLCCYGTADFIGPGQNTQPTTAVTNGVYVSTGVQGDASIVVRPRIRGSSKAFLADSNAIVRLTDATVIPTLSNGPGTASAGITVAAGSVVTKARIPFIASGQNGITPTGAGSVISNSTISGLAGAGIGILSSGDNTVIDGNMISSGASTGSGISSSGSYVTIHRNKIDSNPVDTLQNGIVISAGANSTIGENKVVRVRDTAFVHSAQTTKGNSFVHNKSILLTGNSPTTMMTLTFQPVHYLLSGGLGSQITIMANYAEGGWRGVTAGIGRLDGLINTLAQGNRFVGLSGAAFVASGAGSNFQLNYQNAGNSTGSLVCDATCTGGKKGGSLCTQDSDCSSCNVSVQRCIPEPLFGYIGTPYGATTGVAGASHPTFAGNVMFNGIIGSVVKQCQAGSGTATHVGARCEVDLSTCTGGGGTCSGGPPAVCTGGTQNNKLCCAGSGANTCTARTDTPFVRVIDYGGAGSIYQDMVFSGNQIFGGTTNLIGIDAVSSANLGNINMVNNSFTSNIFDFGPSTIGIKMPPTCGGNGGCFNNTIVGNSFNVGADVVNWKGTYGALSYVERAAALNADQTLTSTTFTDVTAASIPVAVALDANRRYYFNCEPTFSSAALTTGVAFAANYSGTYTTFTYIARLPTATIETGAGTDTMTEQEGNANDDTGMTSLGVGGIGTKYMANVRGNIVTTTAGTLTLRAKAENTDGAITIYAGSNCLVTQVP